MIYRYSFRKWVHFAGAGTLTAVVAILLPFLTAVQAHDGEHDGEAVITSPFPYIVEGHTNYFKIERISGPTNLPTVLNFVRDVTQMAFGPDGRFYTLQTANPPRVVSFAYSPTEPLDGLTKMTNALISGYNVGLGLAFHNSSMYVGVNNSTTRLGAIIRLTDDNHNGFWGEAGEVNVPIVNNIPILNHHVDQLAIIGDSLFVGIGTQTFDGSAEKCYNGTISKIENLNLVPNVVNAAGFAAQEIEDGRPFAYVPGIGEPPAAAKLLIHSAGARNPFSLNFDGVGRLWMANNQAKPIRKTDTMDDNLEDDIHDQFFMAVEKGDYGFPTPMRTNALAVSAGYFQVPVDSFTWDNSEGIIDENSEISGLGPSSSANGFAFYLGNSFPLRYHKQAFICRFTPAVNDTNAPAHTNYYNDIVIINPNGTPGQESVRRIARGFNNALDVKMDPYGNILVADHRAKNRVDPKQPGIYRISPLNPNSGCFYFNWVQDTDGNWSSDNAWDTGLDPAGSPNPGTAPDQWGDARYCITIDRAGSNPKVRLDQETVVQSLTLGDTLVLGGGSLNVVDDFNINPTGTLQVEVNGPASASEAYAQVARLGGTLSLRYPVTYQPILGDSVAVLAYGSYSGSFAQVDAPAIPCGLSWKVQYTANQVLLVVVDKSVPVVKCPANITQATDFKLSTAKVGYNVVASDNCGILNPVCVPASGSNFPIGTTTVNCSATDPSGNKGTCAFTVTVVKPNKAVRPVLECVVRNSDGTYSARYGYLNENSVSVPIPVGSDNYFNPSPQNKGQTTFFKPGRVYNAFQVKFTGNTTITWTLRSPTGTSTSTATKNSTRCN